ncbi:MAG TPA: alpha/beta hydrolase-fold protein, partial [Bryobacteraceae bacterium]|nr:alpha/beta hydrolase-fold protein [Bryobacteraceae bacterium]
MFKWCAITALAAGLPVLFAQPPRSGPQLASFHSSVDDSQQPYALYLPANLDSARKYPLLISLHQEDSNARINLMRVFGEINRFADGTLTPLHFFRPVRNVDFIVASPQARGTMGYQGIAERDIYDLLADLERRFPVDEDRVYLTGISMGGAGALRLALTRPDV